FAQRRVVVVLEGRGVELFRLFVDQRRGDIEKVRVGGLGRNLRKERVRLLDLFSIMQRLEQDALAARADSDEVLLAAQGQLPEAQFLRLAQGVAHDAEGILGQFVRRG